MSDLNALIDAMVRGEVSWFHKDKYGCMDVIGVHELDGEWNVELLISALLDRLREAAAMVEVLQVRRGCPYWMEAELGKVLVKLRGHYEVTE